MPSKAKIKSETSPESKITPSDREERQKKFTEGLKELGEEWFFNNFLKQFKKIFKENFKKYKITSLSEFVSLPRNNVLNFDGNGPATRTLMEGLLAFHGLYLEMSKEEVNRIFGIVGERKVFSPGNLFKRE